MRKLCLSEKFPHKEIWWNYGIFRSVKLYLKKDIESLVKEVMNPNLIVEQLNKIVISIRKAISRQQINFTEKKFTDFLKYSLPKELLSLISVLIDGTEHTLNH